MRYRLLISLSLLFICASCQKKTQEPGTSTGGNPIPTPGPTTGPTLSGTVITIGGEMGKADAVDGKGGNARFFNPYKLCFDARNNMLYVADKNLIRMIDQQNNVSTLLGSGVLNNFDEIYDIDLAPGAAGSLYFTTKYYGLYKIDGTTKKLM